MGGQTIKSQRQAILRYSQSRHGHIVGRHTAECSVHGFAPMLTNGSGVGFDFHQRTDQWGRRSHDRKPRERVGERLRCTDEQMVTARDVCPFMREHCSQSLGVELISQSVAGNDKRRAPSDAVGEGHRNREPGAVTRTVHPPECAATRGAAGVARGGYGRS